MPDCKVQLSRLRCARHVRGTQYYAAHMGMHAIVPGRLQTLSEVSSATGLQQWHCLAKVTNLQLILHAARAQHVCDVSICESQMSWSCCIKHMALLNLTVRLSCRQAQYETY
jgi:hypothetical protein